MVGGLGPTTDTFPNSTLKNSCSPTRFVLRMNVTSFAIQISLFVARAFAQLIIRMVVDRQWSKSLFFSPGHNRLKIQGPVESSMTASVRNGRVNGYKRPIILLENAILKTRFRVVEIRNGSFRAVNTGIEFIRERLHFPCITFPKSGAIRKYMKLSSANFRSSWSNFLWVSGRVKYISSIFSCVQNLFIASSFPTITFLKKLSFDRSAKNPLNSYPDSWCVSKNS